MHRGLIYRRTYLNLAGTPTRIACTQYTVCTLHVHSMYTACTQSLPCLFPASQGMSAADAYALVASQRRITRLPTRLWGFPRPQWRALLRYEASEAERRDRGEIEAR